MAGKYVLGRGGRTKMAIRSRDGGGRELGGGGTLPFGGLGCATYVGGCLHQFSKNVNGSRPISVVRET